MTTTRDPATIERDISQIDQALQQVSNLRAALKQFVQLVEQEQKGPNHVQAFTERIKRLKQELIGLGTESEKIKDVLEYVQSKTVEDEFDWNAMKSEKEGNQKMNTRKEIGSSVKDKADYAYKQLSSIVFDNNPISIESFFTTYTNEWIAQNKDQASKVTISFEREEQSTFSGTICHLKICVHKGFIAELELEYMRASNRLVVHQHDIRGLKEEKHIWQDSQYLIFQKLNLLTSVAFEDMTMFFARESFYYILDWFSSYHDLFTAPCYRCHKVLQFDSPVSKYLPPIVRTWNSKHAAQVTPTAYHKTCFHEYKNSQAMSHKSICQ
ncbi:hypothetical protein G6F66_000900 [Rhizopus arrhizus]|nr:hypothetical protein G6F66_000900 [Rhizopus arrhizus]